MRERCAITDQLIRSDEVDELHTPLMNKSLSSSSLYTKGDHFMLGHSAEKVKRAPIHMQKKCGAHPSPRKQLAWGNQAWERGELPAHS